MTAKEIAVLNAKKSGRSYTDVAFFEPHEWVLEAMKEFAKYHVEKALKEAPESLELYHCNNIIQLQKDGDPYLSTDDAGWYVAANKDSIINSYDYKKII
jgi:hypothetical protein